ncbi:hypothetical protein [Phnomibacter sp. MR]|uniref:hypothetical protein n=1 Tax=Phnomibacter sp. MR TaxID=3042318 RepID=UPI003A80FA4D
MNKQILHIPRGRTMAEIQRNADAVLSNYGGPDLEYGGPDLEYDGGYDDFVDFEGPAVSFANEVETGRRITISIQNKGEGAPRQSIMLFASHASTAVVEGNNSLGGVNVVVNGKPKAIGNIQAFVKNNPLRCLGFKFDSDNIAQNSETAIIRPQSPFRNLEDETIAFDDFTKPTDFRDKMILVPRPFQLDDQTDFIFGVAAGTTVNITFYFGAALNKAKALHKKAKAASGVMSPQNRLIQ